MNFLCFRFRRSASPERSYPGKGLERTQRARSHDRAINPPDDFGLARSVLNERYFEEQASRSKSLDNLANQFGLSTSSKLNKRYQHHGSAQDQEDPKWEDLHGLSTKTSLNDRYFSQPDLIGGMEPRLKTIVAPGIVLRVRAIDLIDWGNFSLF